MCHYEFLLIAEATARGMRALHELSSEVGTLKVR